jgi:hypothetical protein
MVTCAGAIVGRATRAVRKTANDNGMIVGMEDLLGRT